VWAIILKAALVKLETPYAKEEENKKIIITFAVRY
jgi:hypothetical protein